MKSEEITTECPSCQKTFLLPANLLGAKGACDQCGTKFIIEEKTVTSVVNSSSENSAEDPETLDKPSPAKHKVSLKRKSDTSKNITQKSTPPVTKPTQQSAATKLKTNTESATSTVEEKVEPLVNPYLNKKKSPVGGIAASLLVLGIAGGGYYWHTQQQKNAKVSINDPVAKDEKKIASDVEEISQKEALKIPETSAKKSRPPHWSGQAITQDDLQKLKTDLEQKIKIHQTGRVFISEAKNRLVDADFQADLAAFTLMDKCGINYLEKIKQRPEGVQFLQTLFADTNWQEDIMASGPFLYPKMTLNYLYHLWIHGKEHLSNPLYKKLATCVALEHAERQVKRGGISDYHVVRRFLDYVNAHKELRLHADFDNLETWEMRFAIEMDRDSRHFEWHSKKYHYQTRKYKKTCWQAPYRLKNVFKDSIHGREYYKPWDHVYHWPEKVVKVGGVCGALSHYGTSAARISGLPAMAAGQPGHCAYIIRSNNKWEVAYDVTWPTKPKNSFWSATYTHLQLIEDAYKEPQRVLASHRAAWLGDIYLKNPKIEPEYCEIYAKKKRWNRLPNFDQHKVKKILPVTDFNYRKTVGQHNWIAVRYKGSIHIPKTGIYKINLKADDEALLHLSNEDPIKGSYNSESETIIDLEKGNHAFKLDFLERSGRDFLEFKISATSVDERVLNSYALATTIAPLNYELWKQYKKHVISAELEPKKRIDFAVKAIKALEQHQEAAWQLISTDLYKDLSEDEKMQALLNKHKILQQKKVNNFIDYPFDRVLNENKKILGNDKEIAFNLMEKLLVAHEESDRYFVRTLNWAQDLFGKDKNYKERFNSRIEDLATNSNSSERFRDLFTNNITEAAKTGNAENFVRFSKLANKLFKEEPTQATAPFNKIEPFPGYMLSKKGILQTSSSSRWDKVLNHYDVISNTLTGGNFHTNRDLDPYAIVQLEGKGELSGINIVNFSRFSARQLPLVVEVSENGTNWQQVFRTEKNATHWKIDLQGKNIKATHVRVSSDKPEGKKEFFHLRGIFVYGRKLF